MDIQLFFVSLTSSNGLTNAPLGIWPAIFGSFVFIYRLPVRTHVFLAALALTIGVFQVNSLYRHFYGNYKPLSEQTVHLKEGPYKWIWMTPVKATFFSEMAHKIAGLPEGSILFLEGSPL